MRVVAGAVLALVVSVAGVAIAQVAQAPEPFEGAWFDMQPDGRDYARLYPPAAMDQNIQGAVIMCCVVREDRYLQCGAALEWPEGHGFGRASEEVSREFRMSEESYATFRQTPGNWLRRTIVWRLAGRESPEYERARE